MIAFSPVIAADTIQDDFGFGAAVKHATLNFIFVMIFSFAVERHSRFVIRIGRNR